MMEHDFIELAVIDHLSTGRATIEVALLFGRQIIEFLPFHF